MKIKNLLVNLKRFISLVLAGGFLLAYGHFKAKAEDIPYAAPNTVTTTSDSREMTAMFYEIEEADYEDYAKFDSVLGEFGAYSQKDELWSGSKYHQTNIGSGGCGPLSITNGIALAFNVNSKNKVASLLNDVIAIGSKYRNVNEFLLSGNGRFATLSGIRNNIDVNIFNGGENASSILSSVRINYFNDSNIYIFGIMNFDKTGISCVLNMIKYIYGINPDTNIILYNMTAGTLNLQRPFGSLSDSGHYVTLLINVREFMENNCIYLIDSLPKNLFGEHNHRVNYPFVERERYGRLGEFNKAFTVERVSEDIIKITGNERMNKDNMTLLGLEGGCGVIIGPNNLTKEVVIERGTRIK